MSSRLAERLSWLQAGVGALHKPMAKHQVLGGTAYQIVSGTKAKCKDELMFLRSMYTAATATDTLHHRS
jgi:hypothetical protein